MRTYVTGATGTLGTSLVSTLADRGHDVVGMVRDDEGERALRERGATPHRGDLRDPEGLTETLADVDVVVHAASAPQGETEAVDVRGTEALLEAAATADVSNFVYPSIVGIDRVPYSYYQHKLTAEGLVADSDVPSTVLRATQFHEFVADLLGMVARLPVWPIPTRFQVQPIAAEEVATAVADLATAEASGRVPDVGGPAVLTGRELAEAYRDARGRRRPIVRLPLPGQSASAFRAGDACCPDRRVGTRTWTEWLAASEN